MAKCPSCGAEIKASAKRCSKCGAKLDNQKSNTSSSKMIIAIVVVIAVIAIVGAFASGIFTNNTGAVDNTADDASDKTVDQVSNDTKSDDKSSSSESSATEYWASVKADKFHLPDCEWAEKISEDNKIVYDSREDAIADGKEPCGACNP